MKSYEGEVRERESKRKGRNHSRKTHEKKFIPVPLNASKKTRRKRRRRIAKRKRRKKLFHGDSGVYKEERSPRVPEKQRGGPATYAG